ncbi:MAG: argininosuccinate lyase [Xanthomonadales bacterium]|nr:argininosuccinate lyase [Xanthomonadales bacterium]
MSTLLWQKAGVEVDPRIQAFLAGADVLLDREFFAHDIRASLAHAQGLERIGVIDAASLAGIERELDALARAFADGSFVLDDRHEDGHSAIEHWLTQRLGEAGRRIHTGRSRNDQVLVATRLWLKDRLAGLAGLCRDIAAVLLDGARAGAGLPMPGYTHLQRAVPSTVGHWSAGYAEAFIDDGVRALATRDWLDANPLGTAAGYGVNLPLDRAHTTAALGFSRMQVNPAYAQLSRGKFELAALEALGSATLDLRRLAWDLSLFTTAEFAFVHLPAQYTTGSSIMPNKRNPDVVELMRASHAAVAAAKTETEQLLSLPSGYQRDLQLGKGALVHGFRHGLGALALLPGLLAGLRWDEARLGAAIEPAMHATDLAIELAAAGLPFRDAYRQVADGAGDLAARTPQASIAARVSPGACGDLRLDALQSRLADLAAALPGAADT